jgi:hypothetical protein
VAVLLLLGTGCVCAGPISADGRRACSLGPVAGATEGLLLRISGGQPSEEQNVKTLLKRALILAAPIVLRKIRNRRRAG